MEYDRKCEKCGANVRITVTSMGVPGGKDKEQAYCPKCNFLISEHMTDGFVRTDIIQDEPNNIEKGSNE